MAADQACDEGLVMFCARVPWSLHRRIKIAAAQAGRSVLALGVRRPGGRAPTPRQASTRTCVALIRTAEASWRLHRRW